MFEKAYNTDLATIFTLMGIGFLFGLCFGRKFIKNEILIVLVITFLIGTIFFLDTTQP